MTHLLPFDGDRDDLHIAKWWGDPYYGNYFQSIGVIPTIHEFRNYPAWMGNSVMMIEDEDKIIGMVQMYRPSYRNGTVEAGILIDKLEKDNGYAKCAIRMWTDHLFNLGFRKIIFHVLDVKLKDKMIERGCVVEGIHDDEVKLHGKYVTEYRLAYFGRQ